jgi:hypothetical protein
LAPRVPRTQVFCELGETALRGHAQVLFQQRVQQGFGHREGFDPAAGDLRDLGHLHRVGGIEHGHVQRADLQIERQRLEAPRQGHRNGPQGLRMRVAEALRRRQRRARILRQIAGESVQRQIAQLEDIGAQAPPVDHPRLERILQFRGLQGAALDQIGSEVGHGQITRGLSTLRNRQLAT